MTSHPRHLGLRSACACWPGAKWPVVRVPRPGGGGSSGSSLWDSACSSGKGSRSRASSCWSSAAHSGGLRGRIGLSQAACFMSLCHSCPQTGTRGWSACVPTARTHACRHGTLSSCARPFSHRWLVVWFVSPPELLLELEPELSEISVVSGGSAKQWQIDIVLWLKWSLETTVCTAELRAEAPEGTRMQLAAGTMRPPPGLFSSTGSLCSGRSAGESGVSRGPQPDAL